VSYAATEVLVGSSVQSSSLDRVSGIVSARSGNTLTVEDATLIGIDGSNAFMGGTATVKLGASTLVTVLGQGAAGNNTIAQISVGSLIYAFGTATAPSSGKRGARCQRRSRATRQDQRLRVRDRRGIGFARPQLGIPGREVDQSL